MMDGLVVVRAGLYQGWVGDVPEALWCSLHVDLCDGLHVFVDKCHNAFASAVAPMNEDVDDGVVNHISIRGDNGAGGHWCIECKEMYDVLVVVYDLDSASASCCECIRWCFVLVVCCDWNGSSEVTKIP